MTCFVLVHIFVYCLLVVSIYGLCFMKAILARPMDLFFLNKCFPEH